MSFIGRLLRNAEIYIVGLHYAIYMMCVYVGSCKCMRGLSWAFVDKADAPREVGTEQARR